MGVSFDPIKNTQNIALRGLSFERAAEFEFASAWIIVNDRKDYGETRYQAMGFLEERLHALVFTETLVGIRVISFRRRTRERRDYMSKRKPNPEMTDTENPEWTAVDFEKARPALEVLPASLLHKLGVRGPQKAPTKELITIRLTRDVVESFRATGDGWQTRIDRALAEWLKTHQPT
jgi:uncharacterized DUF497 family protein